MNKFNSNMLTLLSGFIFLNKIDDLRNIQILKVHDAASIMQDLMILQIMHISLMHISMRGGRGYPQCYRGDGEEGLLHYRGILGVGCMYLRIAWMHA